ncbi:MAG: hypothetical protein WC835_01155 [Candidatus Paceibacterota bacterium]|jgi:hypothetical protein
MAVTSTFQRKLAVRVFEKMVSEGLTSFDESRYTKILYTFLHQEEVVHEGMSYQWRMIKPLVKYRFDKLPKQNELTLATA